MPGVALTGEDKPILLKEMFEVKENQELIYIFAFQCFFGISGQLFPVMLSIYTHDLKDYMLTIILYS